MRRSTRTLAAAVLLPFLSQATGAASLPALVLVPPAAHLPPPSRFPSAPKAAPKAAPAGPSWWDSAEVVASFLSGMAREALAPAPVGRTAPAVRPDAVLPADPPARPESPAPVFESVAAPPAETVTPLSAGPRDRMLIAMEPGTRVVAVAGRNGLFDQDLSAPPPAFDEAASASLPPFRDRWLNGSGVSARVSYAGPHGRVRGFPDGYVAVFADGRKRYAPGRIPAPFQREFPIYYHGELVRIELELVNRSGRDLTGVSVSAVQETFRPVGGEGMRLTPPAEVSVPGVLPAGGRTVVRWWARLVGPGGQAVNLEQTHVTVTAGSGDAARTLLDEAQAGVIDPPGPGLL